MADARLHDPKRFLAGRRQHGQRQADLVVQVHVRLGGKPAAAQDLREQFLDRGFARRAGEPDHPGLSEALAPAMCQLPKRLDRILNEDERDGRHGIERIPGYQQRGGPGFGGLDRKIVPSERFARGCRRTESRALPHGLSRAPRLPRCRKARLPPTAEPSTARTISSKLRRIPESPGRFADR